MKHMAMVVLVGVLGVCSYFTLALGANDDSGAGLVAYPSAMADRWGPNGHRITGQIAQNHLSDAAAAAVARLLGPSPSSFTMVTSRGNW